MEKSVICEANYILANGAGYACDMLEERPRSALEGILSLTAPMDQSILRRWMIRSGIQRDDPLSDSVLCELGDVFEPELGHELSAMGLYGLHAEVQVP